MLSRLGSLDFDAPARSLAPRCTADCGWITGHSYLAYGPMLVGASQVVFEGVPTYPAADRCWQVVDKYQVRLSAAHVGGADCLRHQQWPTCLGRWAAGCSAQ